MYYAFLNDIIYCPVQSIQVIPVRILGVFVQYDLFPSYFVLTLMSSAEDWYLS